MPALVAMSACGADEPSGGDTDGAADDEGEVDLPADDFMFGFVEVENEFAQMVLVDASGVGTAVGMPEGVKRERCILGWADQRILFGHLEGGTDWRVLSWARDGEAQEAVDAFGLDRFVADGMALSPDAARLVTFSRGTTSFFRVHDVEEQTIDIEPEMIGNVSGFGPIAWRDDRVLIGTAEDGLGDYDVVSGEGSLLAADVSDCFLDDSLRSDGLGILICDTIPDDPEQPSLRYDELRVLEPDGTTRVLVPADPEGVDTDMRFSPDDAHLFAMNRFDTVISEIDVASGARTQLYSTPDDTRIESWTVAEDGRVVFIEIQSGQTSGSAPVAQRVIALDGNTGQTEELFTVDPTQTYLYGAFGPGQVSYTTQCSDWAADARRALGYPL